MSLSFNQDLRKECLRLWCCPAPDHSVLLSHFSDLLKPVLVTAPNPGVDSKTPCFRRPVLTGTLLHVRGVHPNSAPVAFSLALTPPLLHASTKYIISRTEAVVSHPSGQ